MSSPTDEGGCDVRLQPSRVHTLIVVLTHVIACGALWYSASGLLLQLALSVALVCSAASFLASCGLIRRFRKVGRWWTLEDSGGVSVEPCALLGPVIRLQHLVVLRFRTPTGREVFVPVFPDAVGQDAHRRLRMFLRINRNVAG